MIRKATEEDLSRIAEIFVFNNRINYFPIFKQEEYSFGELQVVSMIDHYFGKVEVLENLYVADECGIVKGFMEIHGTEIRKLYVDPCFQSGGIGNEVLTVEGITKTIDGVKVLDNVSFIVGHEDKIAFVGGNELAKTTLFKIISGEMEPDSGSYKWGVTTSQSYFPKDNTAIFDTDLLIVDWLTQYSEIKDATYVRGFLGRMLFAGEDGTKKMRVLSGGEKVRVLLSRMMIQASNVLILDEPTDHLDMESITALNNGLIKFPGVILFASRDHQVVQTTANRIIEFLPDGTFVDKVSSYDEYLENDEMARKRQVYSMSDDDASDN